MPSELINAQDEICIAFTTNKVELICRLVIQSQLHRLIMFQVSLSIIKWRSPIPEVYIKLSDKLLWCFVPVGIPSVLIYQQ